jgi:hypothetical protein
MHEPVILRSEEPLEFAPLCFRCGRATRRVHFFDPDTSMSARLAGLLVPYLSLLTVLHIVPAGTVPVPFCFKCRMNLLMPTGSSLGRAIAAVVLIALLFYCFAKELYVFGVVCFAAALTLLIMSLRHDRPHEFYAFPMRVYRDGETRQLVYELYAGHLYDEFMASESAADTHGNGDGNPDLKG